jgi:4-amino-4-deoxy-L-arabinose transferase-like glycosyltransferase
MLCEELEMASAPTRTGGPVELQRVDWRWPAVLFLLALVPRIVHLLTVKGSPFCSLLILDPRMYDEWGWALARGEATVGVFFQDPLYSYFLAAVYSVVGHHYVPVVLIQLVLGALVAPILYLASRADFGRPTAVAAGAIAALYLPAIYYEGLILKTALATFLVALWLGLSAWAIRRDKFAWWVAAGLVLGLACLSRGNLLMMVPLAAAWLLFESTPPSAEPRGPVAALSDRTRWAAVAALLIGCAVVLAPVAIRNRVVASEWVLTTANAGQNFYIGNNALNETGEYQRLPFVDPNPKYEQRDFANEATRRAGRALSAREVSSYWFTEARGWITDQPGSWLRLLWLKLRASWGAYEIPDNLDYYLYRERAPVLRLALPGFGLLAPLGLLGAALAWRKRGWPRLLALLVIVYSATVILFFVFSRFRMAMMPALYVLAAHGALELWRSARRAVREPGQRPRSAALFLCFLVLFGFVNLPVRGREDSRTLALARAVRLPVRVESSATGHFNLGVACAARAKEADDPEPWLALAEEELQFALAADETHASIPIELGKVLARQGRNAEAVEAYLRAAAIEPANHRIHHALGLLYRRLDNLDQAAAGFTRALQLEPRSAAGAVELGEVLILLDRHDEAVAAFRHALGLSPGNERAQRGLREAEAGSRD